MDRQWEEYKIGPKENRRRLHVTLSTRGEILIGAKTFDQLGRPDAAVLLFDRENSSIGIRPTHPRVENAYLLSPKKKGRHRVLRASAFCRKYGIRVEATTAFASPVIDKGILVLDLKETIAAGRRGERINAEG